MLAALFVAGGYFTLTFYDLFALRTIGRDDVPYRIAALAGFTSYSIGHNVGASVFTGGAVRYRIYSAWGLDAIEVAKICFIAGLTFWLGNVTVLGLRHRLCAGGRQRHRPAAGLVQPRAGALPRWSSWRSMSSGCGRAPRVDRSRGWQVTLPGGPLTLLQIVIGIVDLSFCALAMYMLVPNEPHIGFVTLAVIFVSATLLGFASHSPGGLGVFDAAMLVALWQFDKEDLLAGLLLFRLLYYIIPFALSLMILGLREVMLGVRASRARARRPFIRRRQRDRRSIVAAAGALVYRRGDMALANSEWLQGSRPYKRISAARFALGAVAIVLGALWVFGALSAVPAVAAFASSAAIRPTGSQRR